MEESTSVAVLRRAAVSLHDASDVDAAMRLIGDAQLVLLGEATHGTHEFYCARLAITKRLVEEKGFAAIAVEADWPDALHANRLLQENATAFSAGESLAAFQRFPQWMWRNEEVIELVRWLQAANMLIAEPERKIGFFGIDLYSLRHSMEAVVQYLSRVDPEAARRATQRYACFDHASLDPQRYGYAVNFGMREDCEREVVAQLAAMVQHADISYRHDEANAAEAFYATQHARVAQNAESYYRSMFQGREESWNVRDTHMADTIDALCSHLQTYRGEPAKIVIWAHNSHIGDARATEMGEGGQVNLGQLLRERHGRERTFLLGFTTHAGTVTAASEWDGAAETKRVQPSLQGSYEHLFHELQLSRFVLPIRDEAAVSECLAQRRLERAIGVIYLPERERYAHYFHADMSAQFDAVIHFDRSSAVKALDRYPGAQEEMPETYPSGM